MGINRFLDMPEVRIGREQRSFFRPADFDSLQTPPGLLCRFAAGDEKIHYGLVAVGRDSDPLTCAEKRGDDTRGSVSFPGARWPLDHKASAGHYAGNADGGISCGLTCLLQQGCGWMTTHSPPDR